MYINYFAAVSDAAPSMGETARRLSATNYRDAVKEIRQLWRDLGDRSVSLHSSEYCVYAWQWIGRSGKGWDRNNGGGFEGDFELSR